MKRENSHRLMMRRGAALVAACSIAVAGVMYLEGEEPSAMVSLVFAALNGVLAGVSFRPRPRTGILGHLLVANISAFLLVMSLLFGQYDGLAPYVTPALAALATFLVGRRGALGWTMGNVLAQSLILALPAGWTLNLHQNPIVSVQQHTIVVATTLAVLAIAVLYDAGAKQRQEEIEAQRALAEQALAEAEAAKADTEAALRRAEAASRAKTAFLAAMSHEIRTPLNALIGAADLLEESDPYEREHLEATIRAAGTTLLGQMADVLDFSRIEAGELQVTPRPSSPADVVAEVCSVVRSRAVDKGLALDVQLPSSSPGTRSLDPDRLRQILLNLVGNAVKFTNEGSVTVSLHSTPDQLCIQVQDTGPGIPKEMHDQVFQPFRQAEEGLKRRHEGYGLGLAISSGLAQAMGGRLFLEPCETGAHFRLELPAPSASQPPLHSATDLHGVKVLLVEDNPVNRLIARTMLERLGCDVREAINGQEAVVAVQQHPPDIVLMDLQMPVMDGLEATRRILELALPNTPPILALTANAFSEDRQAALALGMADFLPKPVNQQTLAQALSEHLPSRGKAAVGA